MEKKAIIEVKRIDEDYNVCRCCGNKATTMIELGHDFISFTQTSNIYLCDKHKNELKEKM